MDNIYKAVQLTIDSQNLALSKRPTHVYIANQYVDTNDTPLITAPFIIQKALENGTGVVDIVSSTIGSIYEVRLLCDAEVLISGYFYMPPMNAKFSELELYTSYPPRTPPVINEFWQQTEQYILEKTNTLLNFVQVFNSVASIRLLVGNLEDLLVVNNRSSLVGAVNQLKLIIDEISKNIGDKAKLSTEQKETIVGAINEIKSLISTHAIKYDNPHKVTKAQVELGNVDNTADIDKPISNAVTNALIGKSDKTDTYTKNETDNRIAALASTTFAGHKGYATLADAQAAQSSLVINTVVEVTNDTTTANNGVYLWNGANLVKATNNSFSPSEAYYRYDTSGNLVGYKSKSYNAMGLGGTGNADRANAYASKVIPVDSMAELYISNSLGEYVFINGHGFGFFATDPFINNANRLEDKREYFTDSNGKQFVKVTVPISAKFLVVNTKFNTVIDWIVTENNYTTDASNREYYLAGFSNNPIKQINKRYLKRELYDSTYLRQKTWLGNSGLWGSSSPKNWKTYSINVSSNETYFVKITSPLSYPFKMVYHDDNGYITDVFLTKTTIQDVYRFTVPNNSAIKLMIMNVELVEGTTPTIDLRSTLSIQKYYFLEQDIGSTEKAIYNIDGFNIVDEFARKTAMQNLSSTSNSNSRFANKRVLAFGDSITEGTYGGYLSYVSAILNTTVENFGSSGSRANRLVDIVTAGSGIPSRYSTSFNWTPIDFTTVKAVTIQIGTNDLADNNWGDVSQLPSTLLSDYENPLDYWALFPNNFIGNVSLVIEYIKSKNAKCEIYLVTSPYSNNATANTPSFTTKLFDYYKPIAERYSIPLINAMQRSGIGFKDMAANYRYSYDGTHFNTLGNELWGRYIGLSVLAGN